MKVNREILEKQLILTIEEIVTSKDFEPKKLDNIKERLYRRNIQDPTKRFFRVVSTS